MTGPAPRPAPLDEGALEELERLAKETGLRRWRWDHGYEMPDDEYGGVKRHWALIDPDDDRVVLGETVLLEAEYAPFGVPVDQHSVHAFIAACTPETVLSLLALAREGVEAGRLRAELGWYEEKARNCRKLGREGEEARLALDRDGGDRARKALGGE